MWAWAGAAIAATVGTDDLRSALAEIEARAGQGVLVAAAGWDAFYAVRASTSAAPLGEDTALSRVGTVRPTAVMERALRKSARTCGVRVAPGGADRTWEVTVLGECEATEPTSGAADPSEPTALPVPVAFGRLRIDDDSVGDRETEDEIVGRMRAAGLAVVEQAPKGFDARSEGSRYVLSGSVDALRHEEHLGYREVQLVVDWELTDARTGRPVYRTSTTGYVARPPWLHTESTYAAGIVWIRVSLPEQDLWAVLGDATDRLLARPAFRAILATPVEAEPQAPPPLVVRRCDDARALPADLEEALSSALTVMDGDENIGSAVLVSADGWALTAAHVMSAIEGKPSVKLYRGPTFPVTEVRRDEASDAAMIKLEGAGFACSPLATDRPTVGTGVWAVGTPVDTALELSVAQGIVSGVREIEGFEALQTDASVSPGYSGGPMLLADGTVGALTSSKLYGGAVEGIAFGIPPSVLRSRLGFVEGEVSDPLPTGGLPRPVRALVEDPEDPTRFGELDPATRSRLRKGAVVTLAAGAATAGTGLVLSGAALVGWLSNDAKTQAQFGGLRAVDALGATLVVTGGILGGVGGGLLATAP